MISSLAVYNYRSLRYFVHASRFIAALEEQPGCQFLTLEKGLGETTLAGAGRFDKPRWQWPAR